MADLAVCGKSCTVLSLYTVVYLTKDISLKLAVVDHDCIKRTPNDQFPQPGQAINNDIICCSTLAWVKMIQFRLLYVHVKVCMVHLL